MRQHAAGTAARAARGIVGLGWALLLPLGAASSGAEAPAPPPEPVATVSEVGILSRDRTKPAIDPLAVTLIRSTDRIEACLGTEFGFRVDVSGLVPGSTATLDKVVTTPPIQKPDGKVLHGYTLDFPAVVPESGVLIAYEGYGFDHDYELVPGSWTIEIWMSGKKLASRTFTVVSCPSPTAEPK